MKLNPLSWFKSEPKKQILQMSVDDLKAASSYLTGNAAYFDGDKFAGGFGALKSLSVDYWTLRLRSSQLFNENLYARGIIRRLVTNEINTGLCLEALPVDDLLPITEDQSSDWSENIENRFTLWGRNQALCDHKKTSTFSELQREIRAEALIAGDCLVVMRQHSQSKLPTVEVIRSDRVITPAQLPKNGNLIQHGVEIDSAGRSVAYWIRQADGSSKRLPAVGRSGRKVAWLVYGTDKRLGDTRGMPLLGIVLQSLKELDRYRDSVLRKAVLNSTIAMFIKKGEDKPGTLPITGGAVRRDSVNVPQSDGGSKNLEIASQIPGMVLQELQHGEEPVPWSSAGTDIDFKAFEDSIINGMAWALEMPPEILRLSFNSNYSASTAAVNEFKSYLNKVRTQFGAAFCQPIYDDWLLSEVLQRRVTADGLLDSWRNPDDYSTWGAWTAADWSGAIKPSVDVRKQAQGYRMMNQDGWITSARAARELTGTKFSRNIKLIKRENQLKAEAARPILELQQEFGEKEVAGVIGALDESDISLENSNDEFEAEVDDLLAEGDFLNNLMDDNNDR